MFNVRYDLIEQLANSVDSDSLFCKQTNKIHPYQNKCVGVVLHLITSANVYRLIKK